MPTGSTRRTSPTGPCFIQFGGRCLFLLRTCIEHVLVVGKSLKLLLPRVPKQLNVVIDLQYDIPLLQNSVLGLLHDLLKCLLRLTDQVHLKEIVFFQFLEVIDKFFFADTDLIVVVRVLTVQIDV